jgi:hypothetical protein
MVLRIFLVRRQIAILITLWVCLQCFLFYRFGIVTQFESEKYIHEAKVLLQTGRYSSGNFLFYSVEILLIALSFITHTFPWLVITSHILVNGISVYLFYHLCFDITKDELKAFFVTVFFLLQYYYQLYNVHLFTESLYFSFGIIYTWQLFSIKTLSIKQSLLLLSGLIVLYFTRPTGVFFIPSTILYLVFKFYRKRAKLIVPAFFVGGILLLYSLLNFALNSGGEFDFLLPYLDERIICGVPTVLGQHNIQIPVEKNSVQGLLYIITHYPSLFFSLAAKRLLTFFGVMRSYFSLGHNIFIAIYFYATYLLMIIGFPRMLRRSLEKAIFLFANIFFMVVTVMLSCDEWHNRFILAVLPFFLLLANGALLTNKKAHVK